MSELEIQRTIAETPAQKPAIGQDGPVIGDSNAIAIMKALKENGYTIVPVKVWIYVDANKKVGDDYLKVFATADVAREWFETNDPEGVAFEHEVIGCSISG